MERITKEVLYDLDDWDRIMVGNPLEVFLKGHLWMELVLNDFIAASFQKPEALGTRMMFDGKLRLCDSLDLIPPEIIAAFKEVNKRRNKIAHDLHAEVPDTIAKDLVRSVDSPLIKKMWSTLYKDGRNRDMQTPEAELRMWFYGVVQAAGFVLLRHRFNKANQAALIAYHLYPKTSENLTGDEVEDHQRAEKYAGVPRRPQPADVWFRQVELSYPYGDPPAWPVPIERK